MLIDGFSPNYSQCHPATDRDLKHYDYLWTSYPYTLSSAFMVAHWSVSLFYNLWLIPNPASPQSSSSSAWPCFNSQLILGTAYVPYFGPVSSVHLSTALLHFGCSRPDYHNGSLFHGLGTSSPARRLLFTCMTFPSPFCL
jgi:hypothetical protein